MRVFSKLAYWYFTKGALPYWCIFIIDCIIFILSGLFVYAVSHGTLLTLQTFWAVTATISFYLLFYIIGFRLFHTYAGIIRYSSFSDLLRIASAILIGCLLSILYNQLDGLYFLPVDFVVRDILATSILSLLIMWGVRILIKNVYDSTYHNLQAKRVFIYGVKHGGVGLAKSIRNENPAKYILAGFVSDGEEMQHHILMGVKVYLNNDKLVSVMKKEQVDTLLVSPLKSQKLKENVQMVHNLIENGIRILIVPDAQEWDGKGDINLLRLREINIEDLLAREKIEIDMKAVGQLLSNQKILITGAAGSIGSEIVKQVALYNPAELVLVDQAETPLHDIRLMMAHDFPNIKSYTLVGDIANQVRMEEIFLAHKPDYVFHAAAYKHVPMMEDNPSESIINNVLGTQIIADLSVKYGIKKFVMISTDKAVNPTNVMGCSKRICEIYVQSLDKAIKEGKVKGDTQFVTTRFGNVLGSNGSVIPLFKEQIKNGGPVTVTHPDIIRYFMLIPEACKLVLEAGTMGHGGEIFVFDMGEPVKIIDLAKRMILLSHAQNIEIKITGLRDGEKLYEEVLNEKETTLPTYHPKIKIAKVREYDYDSIRLAIDDLIARSRHDDDMHIVGRMKAIVPEFKSQHSKYEILDSPLADTIISNT